VQIINFVLNYLVKIIVYQHNMSLNHTHSVLPNYLG